MQKSFVSSLLVVIFLLISILQAAPPADLVQHVPGYPQSYPFKVYSGYLDTDSPSRKLHYIFVESHNGSGNKDPVTLWLNGGPGCSSLLGFIQQIGPYYIEDGDHYKDGDKLIENPHSWNRYSNLLFLQSPAGVGYSYSNDPSFAYNDVTTGNDNEAAVKSFFIKFPQYQNNQFFIAGQSYAGKYIPDLAVRIDAYNRRQSTKNKIKFQGILVGNGVMDWRGGSKQASSLQYLMDHDFIDPQVQDVYQRACKTDPTSAGCNYFHYVYDSNTRQVNPYSIYGYCYYNDTIKEEFGDKATFQNLYINEATILNNIGKDRPGNYRQPSQNGAPCLFFGGVYAYFNMYQQVFHAPKSWEWNGPCAGNISAKYVRDLSGSMYQYQYLLPLENFHIIMYNGDWDAAVTYTDTIKNLQKLNLQPVYLYTPFFVDNQHAGFMHLYSGVKFIIIKGASHMVPQSKRNIALQIFKATLSVDSSINLYPQGR